MSESGHDSPRKTIPVGPEAIESYTTGRNLLVDLVTLSERLVDSVAGRTTDSVVPDLASRLFIKQTLHTAAILAISPDFKGASEDTGFRLDPSSVAVLARSVLETYLTFFYLCTEPVEEDERTFRLAVWEHHDLKSRQKGRRNANPSDSELPEFDRLVGGAFAKVSAFQAFRDLPTALHKNIRSGRDALLLTNQEIAQRAGIHPTRYRDDYIHMSSFAHSGPLALAQIRDCYSRPDVIAMLIAADFKTVVGYQALGFSDFEAIVAPAPNLVPHPLRLLIQRWRQIASRPINPAAL